MCLARNIQSYVLLAQLPGRLGFWVMASPIPQKNTCERSQRVSSNQLPDHFSQTPGVHLVSVTASSSPGRLCRQLSYRIDRALKQCTWLSVARNWHVSGTFLCASRNSISRKHLIVFLTAALLKCYVAKTFVLNWWLCSAAGGAAALWKFIGVTLPPIAVSRSTGSVPQGAPESPLVFVMEADEILGGLRPSWERRNFAWTCDEVSLSCLGYADDVLSVLWNKSFT